MLRTHDSTIQARYTAALDALLAVVRADRSVLAAMLCGSLSHDTVWAGSDIDLVLISADEKKAEQRSVALEADGVNVHTILLSRAQFRRLAEGAARNSFVHSLFAKGRLLYTHDPTIADLCSRLREIGERDTRLQLLRAAMTALPMVYKAHKWLITRGDLHYTALWILYAATPLAQIEVVRRRLIADREVLPQAMALEPELFRVIYTDLLDGRITRTRVEAALDTVDRYLAERAETLFAPVLEHLREVGEARSCTELDDHFAKHLGIESVVGACEYLADLGLVGKVSVPVKLTVRSNVEVPELAFVALSPTREA